MGGTINKVSYVGGSINKVLYVDGSIINALYVFGSIKNPLYLGGRISNVLYLNYVCQIALKSMCINISIGQLDNCITCKPNPNVTLL